MPAPNPSTKRLTILCKRESEKHVQELSKLLRERSYELDYCTLEQMPKPGQDIISLLDIEAPFLHSATAKEFEAFRDFVTRLEGSGILWVTGAAQIRCHDPKYSLILGMARTIRNEMLMDFGTLELEKFDSDGWKATANVLHEFGHRVRDPDHDPVLEYAYSDGKVQIGKYHWISVSKELLDFKHDSHPRKLEIGRPGILHTLAWKQEEPVDLKSDWVEVETRAVGLNFKVATRLR